MHRRIPILIVALLLFGIVGWSTLPGTRPSAVAYAQRATPTDGPSPTATSTPVCPTCRYVPLIRSQIFPTDIPTLTPVPTATPIAPTVHVRSYRLIPSSFGSSLYAVGEVENGTSKPVYDVHVIAKFYDGFGAFVATEDGYVVLDRTAPGQRNAFRIILSNAPAGIQSATFTLTSLSSSFLTYAPATIFSNRTRDNAGLEIFGEVRNDQAKDVKGIQVVATFYDGVGGVYDMDWSYADISPLAPGALSTYKISTFEPNLAGLTYVLQAQGYFAP